MYKDEININDNYINNEDEKNKEERQLLNILTDKNLYNDKKTKIKYKKDYKFLIKILNNTNQTDFLNLFKYLNQINIPVLKLLIVGYIEFDFEEKIQEDIILQILSKGINICFNKNLFYYVFKKLSKIYRKHFLIKDILSLKKFEKLFKIWKLLYNLSNPIYDTKLINSSFFIFFQNLNEEKKYFEIDIDDNNEMKDLIISINIIPSPILNINKITKNFSFVKLIDDKNETFELKYNDINLDNNEIINLFSEIFKIKLFFSQNCYDIYINKKKKILIKKDVKFNFNLVQKIEILNNFYGECSSVIFKKKYRLFDNDGEFCPILEPLKMKIYKDKDNNINIKTNAYKISLEDDKEKNKKIFLYQYCGAAYTIKINNEKISNEENIWKKQNIDLSEIEYFGGLNSFIPLFKIIKYIINKLELISNQEVPNGKDKFINNYIDKSFEFIKDILKIMIKMICLSENNYRNFLKIIVPLIGSLAEISSNINNLSSSKLIENNKLTILFNDEIFSTLYLIILISSLPNNIKEIYRKIVGIKDNLENLILSMDSIILDIDKNKIINLDWYFIILIINIEFIFIYYNSSEKVPSKLINQIKYFLSENVKKKSKDNIKKQEAMSILINFIINFYSKNNTDILIEDKSFLNDNNYYFQFIIYMLTSFLNIKLLLNKNDIENNNDSFYYKFKKFYENYFTKKERINITDDYVHLIINFKFFPEEIDFLQKLFPFLNIDNFISDCELIMDELIDYHGKYHHLMKNLFIFNKLWSNQKLFFNNNLEKIKNSKLKYKNINYYTRNFQRPIIYPVLDYKYRYPSFNSFKIIDDFYTLEEDNDDYNFDLDCPELDKLIEEYNDKIIEKIEKNGKINICEVCLIKQTHHVKGNLFIFYKDDKIIIYFYSYRYKLQSNEEGILCCNKSEEDIINKDEILNENMKNNNLCYGSIFKCPKKDAYTKIRIDLDDIRLVLSRIYFYRNSALEIFTETKSYYFNFVDESKKHSLMCTFMYPCQKSYFPINVDGNIIGYIKLNEKIIDKNKFENLINKSNNFIEFISDQTSKGKLCEMSNFDIIIIINLISNRSFNDIYQYPVFPLLFFYDSNDNILNRDFKEHIGFQEISEKSKIRKNLFLKSYEETINEVNENSYYESYYETESKNEFKNELYCFNTHYSNCIYTSNYLIRLFPYSFCALEMQGNGFDDPNRLFFSISKAFYNMSAFKSDLRELIPEFFYLPEMLMNINSINFHRRSNKELVDDVSIPKDITNTIKTLDNIIRHNEIIVDDFNILFLDNNIQKENDKKFFIFIEFMKNKLETMTKDLGSWINIIFGLNQKFSPKHQQYFRTESYINYNNKYNIYLNNNIVMKSVEFGIIPLQTIYDNKILNNIQKRKSEEYEKMDYKEINNINSSKKIKKENKIKNIFNIIYKGCITEDNDSERKDKMKIDKKINIYFKNEYNDYWDEKLNIDFKINNNENYGILEIYKNNILIKRSIDHNNVIIDFFYNRRLNMLATTSYDSFICIYIFPNKLFSMIKHPKNLYFDNVFLCSNPFPAVIAYDRNENILITYSLSGILIKKVKIEIKNKEKIKEIEIKPVFNIYGGAFKDRLKITVITDKNIMNEFYNLPFFNLEYKEILNK